MNGPVERWYFTRHAESEDNVLGRLSDDPEAPLSARGRDQAAALARTAAVLRPSQLWSSPMQRAQETAAPLAARLGLPVGTLEGLRERRLGTFTGRLRAELRDGPDRDALLAWHPGPPGGEGLHAAALRAAEALAGLPDAPCRLIISHAGVLRALIGAIDRGPTAERGRLKIANAAPLHRELPRGFMRILWHELRAELPGTPPNAAGNAAPTGSVRG